MNENEIVNEENLVILEEETRSSKPILGTVLATGAIAALGTSVFLWFRKKRQKTSEEYYESEEYDVTHSELETDEDEA